MRSYQRIKLTEKLIVKALRSKNNDDVTKAFNETLAFFENYDKIEHTTHSAVISSIYLQDSHAHRKVYGLCMRSNMTHTTLDSYRKKYISCFCAYYYALIGKEYSEDFDELNDILKQNTV